VETFSQRTGLVPKRQELQLHDMDARLRSALWNVLCRAGIHDADAWASEIVDLIWSLNMGRPLDEAPERQWRAGWIKQRFTEGAWYEVYDALEAAVETARRPWSQAPVSYNDLCRAFNQMLRIEGSAYGVIDGKVTPIVDPIQLEAADGALARTNQLGLEAPHAHLRKANAFLAQRPDPDCANAIKEALTAVESLCSTLTGERHRGLKPGLDELRQRGVALHGALKKGLENLYGWASDDPGIRHGGPAAPSVELAEARLAVVVCSSVVTFVVEKARTAGLL